MTNEAKGGALRRWIACHLDVVWSFLLGLALLAIYLSTLQWQINGSSSPYATDVGEIQNALPRWGTIHYAGYPLYTFLGSLFVTLLRVLGVPPAAGASFFSAVWGLVAALLLYALQRRLDVRSSLAALCALLSGLATSLWIDASLAEVHTMTMALMLGVLILALDVGREGGDARLRWLAFLFGLSVVHQRSLLGLLPAVALLLGPRWRLLRDNWWQVALLLLAAAATYLYLPIRDWQGADWVFGDPGSWQGFWTIVFDRKSERVLTLPGHWAGWRERLVGLIGLLRDDLPLAIYGLGGLGLLWGGGDASLERRRERWALALVALPYLAAALVIWERRVSDALLAVKLPVIYVAAAGVGLLCEQLVERAPGRKRVWNAGLALLLLALVGYLGWAYRPEVLAITRAWETQEALSRAEALAADYVAEDDAPITLMALWGHDYWALTYAQAYQGRFPELNLVDHNADFRAVLARGDRLVTLDKTFYQFGLPWWRERLDGIHLQSAGVGMVEIAPQAHRQLPDDVAPGPTLALENGIRILAARIQAKEEGAAWQVTVYWQAVEAVEEDYSMAVHLLANDPPQGPDDVLAQADRCHPVSGWYPTSGWEQGEVVRDDYLLAIPSGSQPVGLRVGMYRITPEGAFENSPWLYFASPGT